MSFKPIDLQTSIPRSVEITPLQHQQQQRPAMEQAALGAEAQKQAAREAQRKTKTEGASNRGISDKEPREKQRNAADDGTKDNPQDHPKSSPQQSVYAHPFKGKHIDFTL